MIEPFVATIKGFDAEHSLINFTDLNRLPLPDIEKLVRASVVARRGSPPSETELLQLWGVKEENAAVAPPIVRISMRTQEEAAAEEAAKEEAARKAAEIKRILKPTKPEKSLVKKRAESKAAALQLKKETAKKTTSRVKAPAIKPEAKAVVEKAVAKAAEKTEKKAATKPAAAKKAPVKKTAEKKTTVKKAAEKKPAAKKPAVGEGADHAPVLSIQRRGAEGQHGDTGGSVRDDLPVAEPRNPPLPASAVQYH